MKKSRRTRSRPSKARSRPIRKTAAAPLAIPDERDEQGARIQQKSFRVPAGEPVLVRFLNARPGSTGIHMRSDVPLVGDTVEVAPAAGDAPGIVDFDVDFQVRRQRGQLHMAEAIEVQIQSGSMTYVEKIFPDARTQRIRYHFLRAEPNAGLIWCERGQHIVERDKRGKCPRHG